MHVYRLQFYLRGSPKRTPPSDQHCFNLVNVLNGKRIWESIASDGKSWEKQAEITTSIAVVCGAIIKYIFLYSSITYCLGVDKLWAFKFTGLWAGCIPQHTKKSKPAAPQRTHQRETNYCSPLEEHSDDNYLACGVISSGMFLLLSFTTWNLPAFSAEKCIRALQ